MWVSISDSDATFLKPSTSLATKKNHNCSEWLGLIVGCWIRVNEDLKFSGLNRNRRGMAAKLQHNRRKGSQKLELRRAYRLAGCELRKLGKQCPAEKVATGQQPGISQSKGDG